MMVSLLLKHVTINDAFNEIFNTGPNAILAKVNIKLFTPNPPSPLPSPCNLMEAVCLYGHLSPFWASQNLLCD